jgi:hypothetical protein
VGRDRAPVQSSVVGKEAVSAAGGPLEMAEVEDRGLHAGIDDAGCGL